MSLICLIGLVGVVIAIAAIGLDTLRSLSRPPMWETLARPSLTVVQTPERRQQSLPYVGRERRGTEDMAQAPGAEHAPWADDTPEATDLRRAA